MANRSYLDFTLGLRADGSSNTYSVTLATDPVGLFTPSQATTFVPGFAAVPTGVENIDASSTGVSVSSVGISLGIMTITFASAVPTGAYTILGRFLY